MAARPLRRARALETMTRMGITPDERVPVKRVGKTAPKAKRAAPKDTVGPPAARIVAPAAGFEPSLVGLVTAEDLADPEIHRAFEKLRVKVFQYAAEVMDMQLDPTDKNFGKLLSIKQAISASVLMATTRTRPGDLRPRDDDGVGALLDRMKKANGEGPSAEDMLN